MPPTAAPDRLPDPGRPGRSAGARVRRLYGRYDRARAGASAARASWAGSPSWSGSRTPRWTPCVPRWRTSAAAADAPRCWSSRRRHRRPRGQAYRPEAAADGTARCVRCRRDHRAGRLGRSARTPFADLAGYVDVLVGDAPDPRSAILPTDVMAAAADDGRRGRAGGDAPWRVGGLGDAARPDDVLEAQNSCWRRSPGPRPHRRRVHRGRRGARRPPPDRGRDHRAAPGVCAPPGRAGDAHHRERDDDADVRGARLPGAGDDRSPRRSSTARPIGPSSNSARSA